MDTDFALAATTENCINYLLEKDATLDVNITSMTSLVVGSPRVI
jgi:hypothetical protein